VLLLLLLAQQPPQQGRPGQLIARPDRRTHARDAPVQQILHSAAPGPGPSVFDTCQFEIDFTQFSVELDGIRSTQIDFGQLCVEEASPSLVYGHNEIFFRRKI
jgi:hypothetical protein